MVSFPVFSYGDSLIIELRGRGLAYLLLQAIIDACFFLKKNNFVENTKEQGRGQ